VLIGLSAPQKHEEVETIYIIRPIKIGAIKLQIKTKKQLVNSNNHELKNQNLLCGFLFL
jgi:transcriptional regulator of met regulon